MRILLFLSLILCVLTVPADGGYALAAGTAASPARTGSSASPSSAIFHADQQTASLTVEGYRDLLRSALADLDRRGVPAASQVAGRLRAVGSVTLADGSLVTPDLVAATTALQSSPPDLQSAKTSLRSVIDEMDRSLDGVAAGIPSDAAARLNRVLDRPEFRSETENPIVRFLRELLRPLEKPVGDLLGTIGRWMGELLGGIGSMFDWRPILAFLGLVLLGGLFLWVGVRLRDTMGKAPAGMLPRREVLRESCEELRAEGLRLAQEGDFRRATRALYLAALLYWQEKGRLSFDRALTNREVLARARQEGDPGLAELLAPLVERFDRLWYGGDSCSQTEYEDFAGLATRAWEAA